MPSTAATVIDATRITFTSAVPDWMQIAEVVAIELGTLENVAAASNGGSAIATSSGFGTGPGGAIDGDLSQAFGPNIWHSGSSAADQMLEITLGRTSSLASLTLYARTSCCVSRNFYNYTIYNAANQTLASGLFDARSGNGIASISFGDPSSGAVPEPATWAMMILGFGAAGSAIRSRRRALA
jgi:hypothetical protein